MVALALAPRSRPRALAPAALALSRLAPRARARACSLRTRSRSRRARARARSPQRYLDRGRQPPQFPRGGGGTPQGAAGSAEQMNAVAPCLPVFPPRARVRRGSARRRRLGTSAFGAERSSSRRCGSSSRRSTTSTPPSSSRWLATPTRQYRREMRVWRERRCSRSASLARAR